MNTLRARAAATLLAAARPYLALHLGVLGLKIRNAPFPRDEAVTTLPGPRPARLLVVGDLAASGYGVLLHGMAFPAQLAGAWSSRTGRGCTWQTVADPLLTVRRAAHHPRLGSTALGVDAVVAEPGCSLLVYTAEPGSPSAERLRLLASWAATQEAAARSEGALAQEAPVTSPEDA